MTTSCAQVFTGLSNQGATCYMNSLLQSLFMTPELRKKVYEWNYDRLKHGPKESCILYQLQALFARLQFSKKTSIETKYLTKSFGWDDKESFQQHDIQEFCRVLFEAIEESVKFTDSEDLIRSLYEGYLTDYVKCLNCGYESKRSDSFLDLSLTVRNDFELIRNSSIEQALQSFIRPELLSGSNKYNCSSCNIKTDAKKGLKIEKFPYILVTQIKRFDLNYQTFQRIKLNDRVSFPLILNCNSYLGEFSEKEVKQVQDIEEDKPITIPNLAFEAPKDRKIKSQLTTGFESMAEDKDKKVILPDVVIRTRVNAEKNDKRRRLQEELTEQYKKEGDSVYELFSILIHSGSALGGHYFAYIKNFEDSNWFCFNDSLVKEIDEKEIQKVFGGEAAGSSANAYLLMYRKISNENLLSFSSDEVPQELIQEILAQDEEENKEKESQVIYLKVFYNRKELTVNARRFWTVKELKEQVMQLFQINLKSENVRLRSYNSYHDIFQEVFIEQNKIIDSQVWNYKVVGVETKEDSEEWLPFNPNLITLKVFFWNESMTCYSDPEPDIIRIDKTLTGQELIQQLSVKFNFELESLVLMKKKTSGLSASVEVIIREKLNQNLTNLRIYDHSCLYLESFTQDIPKWQGFVEIEARRVRIRFNDPNELKIGGDIECSLFILIDQQASLAELKSLIGQRIGISESLFLIKRGSLTGAEIKDLTLKVLQANLINNSVVIIEKGTPSGLNQFKLQFSLAVEPKNTNIPSVCYYFIDLFELPLDSSLQILELKSLLCDRLLSMYPTFQISPSSIRLRERNSNRLTQTLQNSETLKTYRPYDHKELSIQLIPSNTSDTNESQMIILICKRFNPSTWQLSLPQEFSIPKTSLMSDLCLLLSSHYQIEVFLK